MDTLDGFLVQDQPVTTTLISPLSHYIGFEAYLKFDSAVAVPTPAPTLLTPSGITANGWILIGEVMDTGPGTLKTLHISAFRRTESHRLAERERFFLCIGSG